MISMVACQRNYHNTRKNPMTGLKSSMKGLKNPRKQCDKNDSKGKRVPQDHGMWVITHIPIDFLWLL